MENETIEQCAERIVRSDVLLCVSALVSTLAGGHASYNMPSKEVSELCELAFELASPVDDWEEAATQAGWTGPHTDKYGATYFENATESPQNMTWCAKDWESLCRDFDIEPYQREVFEHWAVSQWLADKLLAHGERVDTDFEGLNVWARTCTGQGIACDGVLHAVAREVLKA